MDIMPRSRHMIKQFSECGLIFTISKTRKLPSTDFLSVQTFLHHLCGWTCTSDVSHSPWKRSCWKLKLEGERRTEMCMRFWWVSGLEYGNTMFARSTHLSKP